MKEKIIINISEFVRETEKEEKRQVLPLVFDENQQWDNGIERFGKEPCFF